MECIEMSDLEEGEILEYESCPSVSSEKGEQTQKKWKTFEEEEFKARILNPSKNEMDYSEKQTEVKSKEGNNFKKIPENKVDCELDDILSSDEDAKYSIKTHGLHKEHKNKTRKNLNYVAYGTVEDIMSQIGETISRKSKCNYKKWKSRDFRYSYDLVHQNKVNFNDAKSYRIFSSHYSSKVKRKKRDSDTDLDTFEKFYENVDKDSRCAKRKKKKKKDFFLGNKNEEEIFNISNKKVVDFDEMRKTLLEKLKKQKAEEELKNAQEAENSDIQEVEMIIECTNYVDKPAEKENNKLMNNIERENSSEDEELDLMKLRSMALASKERHKVGEHLEETPKNNCEENISISKNKEHEKNENEEDELDRSELLLRAEALKTALLKKHQKRLNKIKKEKTNANENLEDSPKATEFSSNEIFENVPELTKENLDKKPCTENEADETSQGFDCNLDKENINKDQSKEREEYRGENCTEDHNFNITTTNSCSKKSGTKPKVKKKKKKPVSEGLVKEKDKNETAEEDDKTLRFQLLTDLLKKKSLKYSDKKCVLTDSIQTSTNTVENNSKEEMQVKPSTVQNNFPKKNTENKIKKPIHVPKPEIQRIIVHLGPDESSDEDTELLSPPHASNSSNKPVEESQKCTNNDELRVANYEKNVDLLLSRARQKIEEEMKKTNDACLTPEAVYKHLPPSQRLEYIRLKKKIAERERLRKLKKETAAFPVKDGASNTVINSANQSKLSSIHQNSTSSTLFPNVVNCSDPILSKTKVGKNNSEISVSTGKKITLPSKIFNSNKTPEHRKTLNSLALNNSLGKKIGFKNMPSKKYVAPTKTKSSQQNYLLTSSNQAIIAKLKLLLKKIKIEKTIEENYEKEILKLKSQMNIFEKKKSEQQFKIKKLAEESMKIYKLLQPKKEISKSSDPEIKEQKEINPPVEPKKEVQEQETVQETKLEEKPNFRIIESGRGEEMTTSSEEKCIGNELVEYSSPLQVFNKASEESQRVDPNVIMCQFDLMGICKDEECSYQHFARN